MTDSQIQMGLHLAQLITDRLFLLRAKEDHPHSILGAAFVMSLLHGKPFATNAEVVTALAEVYEVLPQAMGVTDYLNLKKDVFDTATLQLLDFLHGLHYVPETNSFLIFSDFYNNV